MSSDLDFGFLFLQTTFLLPKTCLYQLVTSMLALIESYRDAV